MTKVLVSMLLIIDVYTCLVRDLGSGVLSFRVHADLVKWQVLQSMLHDLSQVAHGRPRVVCSALLPKQGSVSGR